MNKLLNTRNSNQYTFCPRCLVGFKVKNNGLKRMSEHVVNCDENDAVKVVYPPVDKQTLQFRKHVAEQEKILTLYADFETCMKTTSKKSPSTEFIQEHVLTGYTITPVLRYNLDKTEIGMNIKPISYTGDDALQHFFASGEEYLHAMELLHEVECKKPIFIEKGSEEYKSHYKDDTCHICEEEINCKISLKEFIKLKHEMKIEEDDYTLEKSMEIPMYDANWLKGPKVSYIYKK